MTEVNKHKGDLKIELFHLHRPKKTFRWSSAADKCFVPATASNMFYALSQLQQQSMEECIKISDTDFEQTLRAYENHNM